MRYAPSFEERCKIRQVSDVAHATIRKAYKGESVAGASWRRIVAAALHLGLTPPTPVKAKAAP